MSGLFDWLVEEVFQLQAGSVLAEVVHFFLYDTVKIFLLLIVVVFLISFIRTFLPPAKIRFFLSRQHRYLHHFWAALLGMVTPFCSCSAIPLFLGFLEAGVPIGVTFSFLIASPMINEIALAMLWGLFGWKIAWLYIACGFGIAVIAGMVLGRIKAERWVEPWDAKPSCCCSENIQPTSIKERFAFARKDTLRILRKIWLYILIGIGVGAWVHGYVPEDFLVRYAGADNLFAVPLAVLIGIPLYSNAAGVIPLLSALTAKGVAMGTALAFTMAVTALSLPEFMILKRVMKWRLLGIFAFVVGGGILLTGYLFNAVL